MKDTCPMKITTVLLYAILLSINSIILPQNFINSSPKNNSTLVSLSTNLILQCSEQVNPSLISGKNFNVRGNKSGAHPGSVKLTDDYKTILFVPQTPFAPDEDVSVTISPENKSMEGKLSEPFTFHFRTTRLTQNISMSSLSLPDETAGAGINSGGMNKSQNAKFLTDTLPANFPAITIGTSNNPSNEKIFLANQPMGVPGGGIGNYLMILNNDGTPVKYKSLSQPTNLFKMEASGLLSYNSKGNGSRIILDTSLTPVDTFKCGNGYSTDGHGFLLLPNGHALVFGNDPQPVDMSQVVAGGNPNATVIGTVIQEVDAADNVVFQWRSWDYLSITDSYFDLTAATVDYVHPNSVTIDNEGNILFSIRHFSSIIKINRNTGNIEWTLGGKSNNFTFLNENIANSPTYFSYQHDISVLPNGNITIFDNGNQHPVQYSRAVEYKLDQANKIATMVWDYRHLPDLYSSAMGSVQRLSNGNTIVGWGSMSVASSPVMTEVHPDKSVALELFLPPGQICYRALKFKWTSQIPENKVTVYEILQGNTYTFTNSTDTTGIKIKFTSLNAGLYTNAIVTKYNYAPLNPGFSGHTPNLVPNFITIAGYGISSYQGEVRLQLSKYPAILNPSKTIVYGTVDSSKIFIAQPTSYDSLKGELVFTTSVLGRFVFGVPQDVSALAPAIISPRNSEIVNGELSVRLSWGTRGIAGSYRVQIATDSIFSAPVIDKTLVSMTYLTTTILSNNTTYFWRVNSINEAGTSDWSETFKFYTASPFISVVFPNGGNHLFKDSTYVVRWATNVTDTVKIVVYKDNAVVSTLFESLVSGTRAVAWTIPASLQIDSSYKIGITSKKNSNLTAVSSSAFFIESGFTGIGTEVQKINDYELSQNYPNPFNPSTIIRYAIPVDAHVYITVFNALGKQVALLENYNRKSGVYEVLWDAGNLPSGLYFYNMIVTGAGGSKFITSKKMVLLK